MTDSVLAVDARENNYTLHWKTSAHFGYDHNPSMLIEMNGVIIFGTKNGLICGVGSRDGKLLWQHKVGNTSIQTITPLKRKEFLITTLDGKVGRIKF
jgi:glucose dehydrogenase